MNFMREGWIESQLFGAARFAGYFKDRKLVFKLNDDLVEWYSIECPLMPEGKWAAFVERDSGSVGPESIGIETAQQR